MSECGCIYVGESESCSFFNAKHVKARKSHRCCECGRGIAPGEKYERVFGKWSGDSASFKTCEDCLSIRLHFFCEAFNFEEMIKDLANHICDLSGEIASECIAPLTPRARDMVCDMIEEYWEDMDL